MFPGHLRNASDAVAERLFIEPGDRREAMSRSSRARGP